MLKDSYGREISDLRVSITDRCNFRCTYCKTARGVNYVERGKLLSYEEIERLSSILVGLGIRKIRVTGGEPMLRKGLPDLISRLAGIPGVEDLALTTNGFNLYERVDVLRKAGLQRVTISLDSLRPDRFFEITRSRDFEKVLRSISAAREAGLRPVKVNCVVVRGVNDDEILDFVQFAWQQRIEVRFIEFMPIDEDEGWQREKVVTGAEILETISPHFELIPREPANSSETSKNFTFADAGGGVGLITPVSRPFCGECSRIRITADGKIRTCLFSHVEHDIKTLLRSGASDQEIADFVVEVTLKKEPGHRINEPDFRAPSRTMSYIGG